VEDGSTSLKLKVELETTDTGEVKSVNSFVDSGATGEFIDRVKLGVRTEMSGLKLCEALASTCRLRRSLDGCLKF